MTRAIVLLAVLLVCACPAVLASRSHAAPPPRDLSAERQVVLITGNYTVQAHKSNSWAERLHVPDVDMAVVAWLFELVDAETDRVVDFEDGSGLFMHHSNVHRGRAVNMAGPMDLLGPTDAYSHKQVLPAPYAFMHLRSQDPWVLCGHVSESPRERVVYQRLTLWYHERTAADQRVHIMKIGNPRNDHPNHSREFERRTFLGKFPPQAGAIIGLTYHLHEGVLTAGLTDPHSGERFFEYKATAGHAHTSEVIDSPITMLPQPHRIMAGQFLLFDTLVNVPIGTRADRHGPMQNMNLFIAFEDQEFQITVRTHLNPEMKKCAPRFLGLPEMKGCQYIPQSALTVEGAQGDYPLPTIPIPPRLRLCHTAELSSCYNDIVYE